MARRKERDRHPAGLRHDCGPSYWGSAGVNLLSSPRFIPRRQTVRTSNCTKIGCWGRGGKKDEYEYGVWMGLAITAIREIHQAAQTNLISIHRHRLVCNKKACCVFSEPNRWQTSLLLFSLQPPRKWSSRFVTKTDFGASASFWEQYKSNQVELSSRGDSQASRWGVPSPDYRPASGNDCNESAWHEKSRQFWRIKKPLNGY